MIGYSFIEEEIRVEPKQVYNKSRRNPTIVTENTECNYLVMFFIVGVLLLVLSDQIK